MLKFSKEEIEGYEPLTVTDDDDDNLVNIALTRAMTSGFPVGKLSLDILVRAETTELHTEYDIELGDVVQGRLTFENTEVA